MKKKLLIVFIAILLSPFLFNCVCTEYEFEWQDFTIRYFDNSDYGPRTLYEDADSVRKTAFGLDLSLDRDCGIGCRFSLSSPCFATTDCISYKCTNKIDNIIIHTIYDYSPEYPAGSDISGLFKAFQSTGQDYTSLERRIKDLNNEDYMTSLMLVLYDTTCIGGTMNFEVEMIFRDSTSIIRTGQPVVLY